MKKLLITLTLTFINTNAVAEWTAFSGSSGNGSVNIYYTPATTRNKDHVVRVWQMKDYATPQTIDNKTYLSVKSLLEVNCKTKMLRIMADTNYNQNMGRGKSVVKNSNPTEWTYIAPDIAGEAMCKLYCGQE